MATHFKGLEASSLLGGSWVVISRVISRVTILITHTRGLITPLIPMKLQVGPASSREVALLKLWATTRAAAACKGVGGCSGSAMGA